MPSYDIESNEIWPNPNVTPLNLTDFGERLLQKCCEINPPTQIEDNIEDFMQRSANFPIEFGINTCRVMSQPKERHGAIAKQISSAYPVIHELVLELYLKFLEHKCHYGNAIELKIYENLSLTDFVQRLLVKRCVCFLGHMDFYKLISDEQGFGGFKEVGTSKEKPPLVLENVLSYDEIKLSALLSCSTHTEFINDGERKNSGRIELDKTKITENGVVIGFVGARFQMPDVMDCEDILVTKQQNTKEKGYGRADKAPDSRQSDYRRLWNEFYGEKDYLYRTAKSIGNPRFFEHKTRGNTTDIVYFDNHIMRKRYAISFDTLLLEAEARASVAGKKAYLHVVGIGLGVWRAVRHQEEIFLDVFLQRLKILLPQLKHVAVVHFAWFQLTEWRELKNDGFLNCRSHPNGGIKIFLSRRNPSEKLPAEFSDLLLVVSFAWDGNALPGNEFWEKCLANSSDSSTASSTLISELMNPHINTKALNGNNLHIATQNHGVLHIGEYCVNILKLS